MKLIKSIIITILASFGILNSNAANPDMEEFGKIYQKFYTDLGYGDLEAIRPFILPLNDRKQFIYGEALVRNPAGPFGVSKITSIANAEGIYEPFKKLVGHDVVLYQLMIVRYRYPENYEKLLKEMGVLLESKWRELEEAYCDLWIFGSDGNWRVACNYFPGVKLNCQSLGIMFSDNLAQAQASQLESRKSRQLYLDALTGGK